MQIAVIYPLADPDINVRNVRVSKAARYLDLLERAGHQAVAVLDWEPDDRHEVSVFAGSKQIHVLKLAGWRECASFWDLHRTAQQTGIPLVWAEERSWGWSKAGPEEQPIVDVIEAIAQEVEA